MFSLGIDPGTTTGVALIRSATPTTTIVMLDGLERKFGPVANYGRWLEELLQKAQVSSEAGVIGIEDYRIYPSHKGVNVGRELYEAKLIGVTEYIASKWSGWQCEVIPAVSKGRWPLARIEARLSIQPRSNRSSQGSNSNRGNESRELPCFSGNHEEDAFIMALLALERKGEI